MTERPIIFSVPMVQAILAGRKTQTRRIIKPQPDPETKGYWLTVCSTEDGREGFWTPRDQAKSSDTARQTGKRIKCPYGQPGDRLYVRERWRLAGAHYAEKLSEYGANAFILDEHLAYAADEVEKDYAGTYRPSIHMPKWASRIKLEIISVGVERLNEITSQDAFAEGVEDHVRGHRKAFSMLWENINGPNSWSDNPWVWVVKFKRVE